MRLRWSPITVCDNMAFKAYFPQMLFAEWTAIHVFFPNQHKYVYGIWQKTDKWPVQDVQDVPHLSPWDWDGLRFTRDRSKCHTKLTDGWMSLHWPFALLLRVVIPKRSEKEETSLVSYLWRPVSDVMGRQSVFDICYLPQNQHVIKTWDKNFPMRFFNEVHHQGRTAGWSVRNH